MTKKAENLTALLIVDLQRDFLPGGALAVGAGDEVVPVINRLMDLPDVSRIVASKDAHPHNHMSFAPNGPWPAHCVKGTDGQKFAPGLRAERVVFTFEKGTLQWADSYSAFGNLLTESYLKGHGVSHLLICGLALDYCVKATALDAAKAGFTVTVVTDATRAVDPEAVSPVLLELKRAGIRVVTSAMLERGQKGFRPRAPGAAAEKSAS